MLNTYNALCLGQEEPEEMPNEVAYKLAQLLGHDHYLIHRALVNVNPKLVNIDGDFFLEMDYMPAVVAETGSLLLAQALG